MNDLSDRLERLGLSEYLDVFLAEGYDTWETVCDVTESDLHYLNVKLGHRRKLQRAIRDSRGIGGPSDALSTDGAYRSEDSAAEGRTSISGENISGAIGSTKRKYRRHPKIDENAPERASSAYVIFSNHIRELLRGQELSFAEIAKMVGERWQLLPQPERDVFERQAAAEKERYYAQLAEYKKTPEYVQYQEYLADFKAKHAIPRRDGKRTRTDVESLQHGSSSRDIVAGKRRVSIAVPEAHFYVGHGSSSGPPSPTFSTIAGHSMPAYAASPSTHTFSMVSSPQAGTRYSPMSASPAPVLISRDSRESASSGGQSMESRDLERQLDPHSSNRGISTPHIYGVPPHSHGASPYQSGGARISLPSRHTPQETADHPPALVHEETSMSTESSIVSGSLFPPTSALLPLESNKVHRILPMPVPSVTASPSPLDPRPSLELRQSNSSSSSGWPALLRATELFRDADKQSNTQPATAKQNARDESGGVGDGGDGGG